MPALVSADLIVLINNVPDYLPKSEVGDRVEWALTTN